LPRLQPHATLITGDIADSKTAGGAGLQQEAEWAAYRRALESMKAMGLQEAAIHDLRGNHDTFNSPLRGGDRDLFLKYAAEGRRAARTGPAGAAKRVFISTVSVPQEAGQAPPRCPAAVLLGIDFSVDPGLKSPTNFAGRATEALLHELEERLGVIEGEARHDHCPQPPIIAHGWGFLSFS
jgi:hypothetical protein